MKTMPRSSWMFRFGIAGVAGAALASSALAQNLFLPEQPPAPPTPSTPPAQPAPGGPGQQPPPAPPPSPPPAPEMQGDRGQPNPASYALTGISMFVVNPPQPHHYAKNDLVEVIINESSIQKIAQTYDTKKNYDFLAELKQFPSLEALLKTATLANGIGTPPPSVAVGTQSKYKGDATMDRADQVTAKITATVVDVKPNGTLVVEARESIQSDKEITTMVLSGVCRSDDITKGNTVRSSQLAELNLRILHEGDVKTTAEKGLIPRILETIFNF